MASCPVPALFSAVCAFFAFLAFLTLHLFPFRSPHLLQFGFQVSATLPVVLVNDTGRVASTFLLEKSRVFTPLAAVIYQW